MIDTLKVPENKVDTNAKKAIKSPYFVSDMRRYESNERPNTYLPDHIAIDIHNKVLYDHKNHIAFSTTLQEWYQIAKEEDLEKFVTSLDDEFNSDTKDNRELISTYLLKYNWKVFVWEKKSNGMYSWVSFEDSNIPKVIELPDDISHKEKMYVKKLPETSLDNNQKEDIKKRFEELLKREDIIEDMTRQWKNQDEIIKRLQELEPYRDRMKKNNLNEDKIYNNIMEHLQELKEDWKFDQELNKYLENKWIKYFKIYFNESQQQEDMYCPIPRKKVPKPIL